jgi:hypothetical protein|tara:strand:+ start:135 stop:338 length:204 start_codon:yes stop_codon:yes gene_type:complete
MGLLDKLTTGQSNLTGLNGATPEVAEFSISKLHDTYSADGTPNIPNKPAPTNLVSGNPVKYLDNLPR